MSEIIDPPVAADSIQRLKPNAVGLIGVLFMAVATAAPITAMVGNVPIAVGVAKLPEASESSAVKILPPLKVPVTVNGTETALL